MGTRSGHIAPRRSARQRNRFGAQRLRRRGRLRTLRRPFRWPFRQFLPAPRRAGRRARHQDRGRPLQGPRAIDRATRPGRRGLRPVRLLHAGRRPRDPGASRAKREPAAFARGHSRRPLEHDVPLHRLRAILRRGTDRVDAPDRPGLRRNRIPEVPSRPAAHRQGSREGRRRPPGPRRASLRRGPSRRRRLPSQDADESPCPRLDQVHRLVGRRGHARRGRRAHAPELSRPGIHDGGPGLSRTLSLRPAHVLQESTARRRSRRCGPGREPGGGASRPRGDRGRVRSPEARPVDSPGEGPRRSRSPLGRGQLCRRLTARRGKHRGGRTRRPDSLSVPPRLGPASQPRGQRRGRHRRRRGRLRRGRCRGRAELQGQPRAVHAHGAARRLRPHRLGKARAQGFHPGSLACEADRRARHRDPREQDTGDQGTRGRGLRRQAGHRRRGRGRLPRLEDRTARVLPLRPRAGVRRVADQARDGNPRQARRQARREADRHPDAARRGHRALRPALPHRADERRLQEPAPAAVRQRPLRGEVLLYESLARRGLPRLRGAQGILRPADLSRRAGFEARHGSAGADRAQSGTLRSPHRDPPQPRRGQGGRRRHLGRVRPRRHDRAREGRVFLGRPDRASSVGSEFGSAELGGKRLSNERRRRHGRRVAAR